MTEDQLGQETLVCLTDTGYTHVYGPEMAPDGDSPERKDCRHVVLSERLCGAIDWLNP